VQAKLLKVVEDLRFRRLGDVRDRQVDVRLVAATHQDLGRLVQEKKFREDLYYRISALPLVMPPLRERGRDVVLLARRLMETIGPELGRAGVRLSAAAEASLAARAWPGNVRELRNVLERAILLSDSTTLESAQLGASELPLALPEETAASGGLTLAEAERRHIEAVLREAQGIVPRAASVLGLSRSALYERIKKHGIAVRKTAAS
jgi:transcriptional regulator with GAF, ATPase, and Fis domain